MNTSDTFHQNYIPEPNSGCWLWVGENAGAYGTIRHTGGQREKAHRYSWRLHNGDFDTDLRVCHHCDVPMCVNPTHLFLGTPLDNSQDMVRKGRSKRGEKQWRSILTEETAREVLASAETSRAIARRLGVAPQTIFEIRSRKTWKHIDAVRSDDPKKNLSQPGSLSGNAKLTEADIPVIRARLAAGEGGKEIGRSYGVTKTTIYFIQRGHTWKHVA